MGGMVLNGAIRGGCIELALRRCIQAAVVFLSAIILNGNGLECSKWSFNIVVQLKAEFGRAIELRRISGKACKAAPARQAGN